MEVRTQMRCLHCNRRLALFKSLRRKPYCSEQHWNLYRSEQAAVSIKRLLDVPTDDRVPVKALVSRSARGTDTPPPQARFITEAAPSAAKPPVSIPGDILIPEAFDLILRPVRPRVATEISPVLDYAITNRARSASKL